MPRSFRSLMPFAVSLVIALGLMWWRTRGLDIAISAQVWGAFGSVAAVVTALLLSVQSSSKAKLDSDKRAAAAAILVSANLYELRAIVDGILQHETLVRSDQIGYGQWLSRVSINLSKAGPVIEDRYLPMLTDLPTRDLFTLVVANNWLNRFKKHVAFKEGVTLQVVIENFDKTLIEISHGQRVIVPASLRMHELSGIGGSPPWEKETPSWVQLG